MFEHPLNYFNRAIKICLPMVIVCGLFGCSPNNTSSSDPQSPDSKIEKNNVGSSDLRGQAGELSGSSADQPSTADAQDSLLRYPVANTNYLLTELDGEVIPTLSQDDDDKEFMFDDAEITFRVVFNRVSQDKLPTIKGCDNDTYMPVKDVFDLNKTSILKRQNYLSKKKCINHWYGADSELVGKTLIHFSNFPIHIVDTKGKQHSLKNIKNSKHAKKILKHLKREMITREFVFVTSVEHFNDMFATKLYMTMTGENILYSKVLSLSSKEVANAMLGVMLLSFESSAEDPRLAALLNETELVKELEKKSQNKKRVLIEKRTRSSESNKNVDVICNEKTGVCEDRLYGVSCMIGNFVKDGHCGDFTFLFPTELASLYDFPQNTEYGRGQDIAIIAIIEDLDKKNAQKQFENFVRYQYPSCKSAKTASSCPLPKGEQLQWDLVGKPIADAEVGEFDLDLAVISSIVPKANIHVVAPQTSLGQSAWAFSYDLFAGAVYHCVEGSIEEDNCKSFDIISSSYGSSVENNFIYPLYAAVIEDSALRNITHIVASGDLGSSNHYDLSEANTLYEFNYDSTAPYLTSVGGTSLGPEVALKIRQQSDDREWVGGPETNYQLLTLEQLKTVRDEYSQSVTYVWNDLYWDDAIPDPYLFTENAVSSGGPTRFSSPPYQSSLNNKKQLDHYCNNRESCRHYPDLSFAGGGAVNYLVPDTSLAARGDDEVSNHVTITGGTSASAPLFAALVAVMNSQLKKEHPGFSGLGFINPLLYRWKDESGVYKDATKGSNCTLVNYDTDPNTLSDMLCFNDDEKASDPLFKAGKGFDFPTGLGELQGKAFMSKVRALLGESAGVSGKN